MRKTLFPLEDYNKYRIPSYLDGRYFNLVLSEYPGLVETPLIFTIRGAPEGIMIDDNGNNIKYNHNRQYPSLIRMIIEIDENAHLNLNSCETDHELESDLLPLPPNYGSTSLLNESLHNSNPGINSLSLSDLNSNLIGTSLVSRHSNLLVLDHNAKTVIRFEPLYNEDSSNLTLDETINILISQIFPTYKFMMSPFRPQHSSYENTYCTAYVLKTAYNLSMGLPLDLTQTPLFIEGEEDYDDIAHFARTVEYMYGPLPPGIPDIEFGPSGGILGGALLGGLGGGVVGGAVVGALEGPGGVVICGLGGGILGAGIGSNINANLSHNHGRNRHRHQHQYRGNHHQQRRHQQRRHNR